MLCDGRKIGESVRWCVCVCVNGYIHDFVFEHQHMYNNEVSEATPFNLWALE